MQQLYFKSDNKRTVHETRAILIVQISCCLGVESSLITNKIYLENNFLFENSTEYSSLGNA